MPHITRQLLRKRSEHNEGIISTLEEISLHQEELEEINEVLGMTCRKLKILYLQNNIIPKMENLHHMKDLEYLNLALNNVSKIEGLSNCEFLKKLDLTVNFIDFDTLEESIDHLCNRVNLQDLYLMGNPAQASWENFQYYVIAKLPQLKTLDGTEITRSLQIRARQMLPKLEVELKDLAEQCRRKKAAKVVEGSVQNEITSVEDDAETEMTENTPEARIKIYQELAQQKKEKEERERANAPKQRDYEQEQNDSVREVRDKESAIDEKELKQKNEGGWDFYWDEESKPGYIVLEVKIAKFLDSSLIDVDVHPTFVSMIIKSKVLRLRLPAEVKVAESKCQRSKTSGSLLIIMPKVNPRENTLTLRNDSKPKDKQSTTNGIQSSNSSNRVKHHPKQDRLSLQEQMMRDGIQAKKSNNNFLELNNESNSHLSFSYIVPCQQVDQDADERQNKFTDLASKIMELS